MTFDALGLAGPLLRALAEEGIETPTPIQAQAIPVQLKGRDVLGIAQTGTGKTASFSLPILEGIFHHRARPQSRQARALILAPTRELAVQIDQNIRNYARHMRVSTTLILGGMPRNRQIRAMARGIDILIATPGRLTDLMRAGHVDLSHTKHLVLDEADRMLDMGFIGDVRKVVAALPIKRQSVLFSATMPKAVEGLAAEILQDPARVEIAAETVTVDRIDQSVVMVPTARKKAYLSDMLGDPALERVVVFTRTKHGADRLTRGLEKDGHSTAAIHGNKSQAQRQRALNQFKTGKVRILVATDIAARGIDVDGVSHVINYELPNEAESYVHRIGRTARAGASGIAVSLCDAHEEEHLFAIEKLIKRCIPIEGESEEDFAERDAKRLSPHRGRPRTQGAKKPGGKSRRPHRKGQPPANKGQKQGQAGQPPKQAAAKPRPQKQNNKPRRQKTRAA